MLHNHMMILRFYVLVSFSCYALRIALKLSKNIVLVSFSCYEEDLDAVGALDEF